MDSKLKLGLIYSWDENWIGGTYYVQNLMNAIYEVEPELKFKVYASEQDNVKHLKEYRYFKNIEFESLQNLTFHQKAINKLFRLLRWKAPYAADPQDVETVYPGPGGSFFFEIKNKLYWIPDLQDCYHPEYFSNEELETRYKFRNEIITNNFPIVFSSESALEDFKIFHPNARNNCFVLKFAVTPPDLSGINKQLLLRKYNISGGYFICSNQFWKHKNHRVLLDAFHAARKKRKDLQLILTGKESDRRNKDYIRQLKEDITNNEGVISLGFIDRQDQLGLIKYSIAVIQPSLFEGWGTVVEDAKAIGKHVILSDMPVHREQMTDNCTFFNPLDSEQLEDHLLQNADKILDFDSSKYIEDFRNFGRHFLSICNNL